MQIQIESPGLPAMVFQAKSLQHGARIAAAIIDIPTYTLTTEPGRVLVQWPEGTTRATVTKPRKEIRPW